MNMIKQLAVLIVAALAAAMMGLTRFDPLGWQNFNRPTRRQAFGIRLSSKYMRPDGSLIPIAGGDGTDDTPVAAQIEKMRTERQELVQEADAQFEAARGESRALSAEEQARDDEIHTRLTEIEADLPRLERQAAHEQLLARDQAAAVAAASRAVTRPPAAAGQPRVADPEERYGFDNLADFALAVMSAGRPGGNVDKRLTEMMQAAPTNFHRETGADEGYMVPPAMRQEIWELVFGGEDLLNLVTPEPTNSNSVELLADETTPWGATGIQANWRAEGAQMNASKLATKLEQVRLHELYAFALATEEMLQDAPRLNARLTRKAAAAIRWKASEAIMFGTGSGQPLGWMTSAAAVAITRSGANLIATADVANVAARLLEQDGSNLVWLAHRSTLPQLLTLTIGDQPVWTPPNAGLRDAPGGALLGTPLRFSQHCPVLGTAGDLQLVDLEGYYATQREDGINFASSIHLFFDYNMQAFRWTFRFGGQPYLSSPVSSAKGSATLSHFVAVGAP